MLVIVSLCSYMKQFNSKSGKNSDPMSANKSLGQHFLRDEEVCVKIAEASMRVGLFNKVVEVGPGKGILTKHLYEYYADNLSLIEYDTRFINLLKEEFPRLKDRVYNDDILRFDFTSIEGNLALIGNFPYNISSQILFKALEYKEKIPVIIGMFQKEMAERVAAVHGNKSYGVLSVLIQAFYEVEYLFDVPPEVFSPPPKVMSGVIKLILKTKNHQIINHQVFRQVVKTAFNQRRKTMRNSLKSFILQGNIPDQKLFDKRPEQLSVSELIDLANYFNTYISTNEAS